MKPPFTGFLQYRIHVSTELCHTQVEATEYTNAGNFFFSRLLTQTQPTSDVSIRSQFCRINQSTKMEGYNKVHAGCKSGPLKERQHPILHRAHQHEGKAFKNIKVAVSLYGAAAFFRTGGPLHQAVQKPKPGLLHH